MWRGRQISGMVVFNDNLWYYIQKWLSLSFVLHSFFSVWNWQYARDNIPNFVVMDQNLIDDDFSERGVKVDNPLRNTDYDEEKSYKCNQFEYASSVKSSLRSHLKIHSGEKSNKCNQCDYASSTASNLRAHLKTHSGEKSNKCNQCDFASSQAGDLKRHLKTQWRKVKQM